MKAFFTSIGLMTALVGCASTPAEAPVADMSNCANVAWSDNPDGKRSKSPPPPGFDAGERARFGAFLIAPMCGAPKEAKAPPYWPKGKNIKEVDCLAPTTEFFEGQRICWTITKLGG